MHTAVLSDSIGTKNDNITLDERYKNVLLFDCKTLTGTGILLKPPQRSNPGKKQEAKEKRTVTFAPSTRPYDNMVLYVKQSNSSITLRMPKGSITFISTCTNRQNRNNKIDGIGKQNIRLPLAIWPYMFNVLFDYSPQHVVSFFRKPTYRVRISIGAMQNTLRTMTSVLDSGAGRKLCNWNLLPTAWKESVTLIKALQLRKASWKVLNIEGIVPLFTRACNLRVCMFWIIEKIAVDVYIRTPFMDPCLCGAFSTEWKIFPCDSWSVAIITEKTAID